MKTKDPLLVVIKPESISAADKEALTSAGIIVIEHPEPSEFKFLKPIYETDGNGLMSCALKALSHDYLSYSIKPKEKFAELILKLLDTQLNDKK